VSAGSYLRHEDYQDEFGNDVTLIDEFLSYTPAERLAAWQSFANGILELRVSDIQPDPSALDAPRPSG
jgi:hypothetical protein